MPNYKALILIFFPAILNSQVVINEVMHKPATSASVNQGLSKKEYVEIYNSSCSPVDISCWIIGSSAPLTGTAPYWCGAYQFSAGTIIGPGEHLVLGGTNSDNGTAYNAADIDFNVNVPGNSCVTGAGGWLLPNGDGWVALYNSLGVVQDALYWSFSSNPNVNTDTDFSTNPCVPTTSCSSVSSLMSCKEINQNYPAILSYGGLATSFDLTFSRVPDGGSWQRDVAPSITGNQCNDGQCASVSTFELNASITAPSCGQSNGSISFNPTPSDTYTYSWSPNVSVSSGATGLAAGTYTISVLNSTGCQRDTTVSLNSTGGITGISVSTIQPSCGQANGTVNLGAVAGGTAAYEYNFDGTGFSTVTSYTSLNAGTYTLSVLDASGCDYDTLISLANAGGPVGMSVSVTPNTCSSLGSITVTNVDGGTPSYQYSLNNGTFASSNSFSSLTFGSYTVSVQDVNGCEFETIASVENNTALGATASATPNSACLGCNYSGPSIMINEINIYPANGDGSIFGPGPTAVSEGEWIELYNPDWCDSVDISGYILGSYNSTGSTLSVPYVSDGMAFVIPNGTVVPPLGFVVVRGQNAPAPPAGVVDVIVNNSANNLCIDGGIGNSRIWFQNAGGWFAFYDANGVPQDVISWGAPTPADLNGLPCIPPSNSLPTSVTQLDSYNSSGVGINLGPSSIGMTYVRIPDGGSWSSSMASESFSYGTCNDPLNCLAETGVSACNGTGTLNVTIGTAPYAYEWNDDLSQTTAVASGLCPGTYDVVVSDAAGCSETYSITIDDDVFVIDAVVQNPSCSANDGSIAVSALPAAPSYEYVWTSNTGITDSSSTVASNLGVGTYSVSVTAGACERDTTLTLVAPLAIDSVAVNTSPTTCGNQNGSIIVSEVYGGTQPYLYNFNSTGTDTDTSYANLSSGSYSLQVTDDAGCTYTLNGITIDASAGITSITTAQVLPNCGQSDGEIAVESVQGGAAPYSYYINNSLADSSVFTQLPGGQYIIDLIDVNGCAYSETILLGEDGESFIHVPNVFSPNDDNANDTWFVSTGCVQNLNCLILNRWGNLVYEFNNPNGLWDGKSNGDKVTSGVYFYKLEIEFTNGEKQSLHGNITVLY
jgi:gliding motility-associated-like protein